MLPLKKTIAKSISSTLACAMILGTTLLPSQALTKDQLVEGVEYRTVSKTYETTSLETRKLNSDYLFTNHIAPDATVVVEGETFSMVLYVANDDTLGCKHEDGLFEEFCIKYDDEFYQGTILSSYAQENPPHKTFLKDGNKLNSFLQLYAGESYDCDVLTISGVPVEALEESLLIIPLIRAGVFTSYAFGEDFLIDLGIDFEYEEIPSEEEPQEPSDPQDPDPEVPVEPTVEERQVTITATKSAVTAPEPDYSITIPTTVAVPALVAGEDANISYAVTVDLGTATSVTVSSCTAGDLTTSSGEKLPFTNSFTTETCTVGGLKYGTVTISKDHIATAVAGDYTGNINFAFSFTA